MHSNRVSDVAIDKFVKKATGLVSKDEAREMLRLDQDDFDAEIGAGRLEVSSELGPELVTLASVSKWIKTHDKTFERRTLTGGEVFHDLIKPMLKYPVPDSYYHFNNGDGAKKLRKSEADKIVEHYKGYNGMVEAVRDVAAPFIERWKEATESGSRVNREAFIQGVLLAFGDHESGKHMGELVQAIREADKYWFNPELLNQ